ncbi:MAG: 3-deoxy-manno-octulosonate cytidylyltransferase [Muribaculum sp.]|nr:3-deoxy-manno-octulosonate cytidylyltransferase [Muribaculum sp.]
MKIIAIIPARYSSTRFPGKPLADICGKPMIWWVYNQVSQVKRFSDVFVAIDDERIRQACEDMGIKYVMTRNDHPDHIARIQEVSDKVEADIYVCVNGDEPLISPKCIDQALPEDNEKIFFSGAMRKMTDAAETIDPSRIKVVVSDTGRCLYITRTPAPYPKGSLMFAYNKYVGIECFSKEALDFFVATPQANLEKIEDIDHLRFLEHGRELKFKYVDSESISVDTPKDLEKVRILMEKELKNQ